MGDDIISNILASITSKGNTGAATPTDVLGALEGANTPTGGGLFTSDNLNMVGTGVGALSDLFNIYSGIRGLNLAEDQFDFNRDLSLTNLANQSNLTNERLSTRQATRLRSQGVTGDANAQAVSEFMNKYGVKGNLGG